jgi:hypothetical protein
MAAGTVCCIDAKRVAESSRHPETHEEIAYKDIIADTSWEKGCSQV